VRAPRIGDHPVALRLMDDGAFTAKRAIKGKRPRGHAPPLYFFIFFPTRLIAVFEDWIRLRCQPKGDRTLRTGVIQRKPAPPFASLRVSAPLWLNLSSVGGGRAFQRLFSTTDLLGWTPMRRLRTPDSRPRLPIRESRVRGVPGVMPKFAITADPKVPAQWHLVKPPFDRLHGSGCGRDARAPRGSPAYPR
jgi:hypothetical protein